MTEPKHHGACKGPMRKIVGPTGGRVRLECGHEIWNDTAIYRARCWRCAKSEAPASREASDREAEPGAMPRSRASREEAEEHRADA